MSWRPNIQFLGVKTAVLMTMVMALPLALQAWPSSRESNMFSLQITRGTTLFACDESNIFSLRKSPREAWLSGESAIFSLASSSSTPVSVLCGHVYRDQNGNGQYDTGEGIAGASVYTQNGYSALDVTLEGGFFSIQQVPCRSGYVLFAEAFGYSLGTRADVRVSATESNYVDIALTPIADVTDLTIEELRPNPNDYDHDGTEDSLSLMKGGTGFRYYQVVNKQGQGVPKCAYQVTRSDGFIITNSLTLNYQGIEGVTAIAIPEAALGVSSSSGDVSLVVSHLNGVELPGYKKKAFMVRVRPREFETRWEGSGNATAGGKLFLGAKAGGAGSMTVSLRDRDGIPATHEDLLIMRREEGSVGATASVPYSTELGVSILGLGDYAGAAIKGHLMVGVQFHDEHVQQYNSISPVDMLARSYLLTHPAMYDARHSYVLEIIRAGLEGVVLTPWLSEVGGGIYATGEAKAKASATVGSDNPVATLSMGLGGGVKGSGKFTSDLSVRPRDVEFIGRLAASVEMSVPPVPVIPKFPPLNRGSLNVGSVLSPEGLMVAGLDLEIRKALGCQIEEAVSITNGLLKRLLLKARFEQRNVSANVGDGCVYERSWNIRGDEESLTSLAHQVPLLSAILLAMTADQTLDVVLNEDTLIDQMSALYLAAQSTNGRIFIDVDDRMVRSHRIEIPVFSLFVIVPVGGASVGGNIESGAAFDTQSVWLSKRSVFTGTHFFEVTAYPDDPVAPPDIMSLADVYEDAFAPVDWGSLLTYAQQTVEAGVPAVINTLLPVGQGMINIFSNSISASNNIVMNAWQSAWSWVPPSYAKSTAANMPYLVSLDEHSTNNWRFGIGGFYDLKPSGLSLDPPGSLVISYNEFEVTGIPESSLACYMWNTNSLSWEHKGGTVDLSGNSVSNLISVLGLYTLAPRMPYGSYALIPTPASVTNDGVSTVSFLSEVMSNNDTTVVADGQLFTISTSCGDVMTADADEAVQGIQVAASAGRITFMMRSSMLGTGIVVSARSVTGEAYAYGAVGSVSAGAPSAPANVLAAVDGTSIRVTWDPVTNSDVAGYTLFYDSNNGTEPFKGKAGMMGHDSPIDVGGVTSYRLWGLTSNVTYYIALKSRDAFGLNSPLSSVASVLNTAPPDSDADGLPDNWENLYVVGSNGVQGLLVAYFDSMADNDGDGMNNWSEYIAGMNPIDSNSVFRFLNVQNQTVSNGVFVSWPGAAGRQYQLLRATNLMNSWESYGGVIPGSNGTMRVFVSGTNTPQIFIKVNVQKN